MFTNSNLKSSRSYASSGSSDVYMQQSKKQVYTKSQN